MNNIQCADAGLNSKMLDFQKKIGIIKKDSTNPHFKNTYASLSQILSEVKPILNELGLIVVQPIDGDSVSTYIIDPDTGVSIKSIINIPQGLTPQQTGSAVTYFRRYTISSLLALEIDDDDGDSSSNFKNKPEPVNKKKYKSVEQEYAEAFSEIQSSHSMEALKKSFSTYYKKFYGDEQTQSILKREYDLKKIEFEEKHENI